MIQRYSRPDVADIWSDANRYAAWLRVELAACEAMEAAGSVPKGTAATVRERAEGKLVPATIDAHEQRTRHDVIAFLSHVEELAGEPSRWLHLGMTSSDVLDAALATQLVASVDVILTGIDGLLAACRKQAEAHRKTAMIGRSHGIHAEPITAGIVFAGFYAEIARARVAIVQARKEVAVGKIAGAVGTYANLTPAIEKQALATLGLVPETVPTQVVSRDRHAALFEALARLGTAIERMSVTVRHWQRTEVGEAMEAFGKGQKGSSAMPHKKNPILSENLTGLARMLRAFAQAARENVVLWHERDISHSSVERYIGPDATVTADFMVKRATSLIDGLVVNPTRCTRNLEMTGGLYNSEAVMLALVRKGLVRQNAYERVQRSALKVAERIGMGPGGGMGEGPSFQELLSADPDVNQHLTAQEVGALFDLAHHLRHADTIIDRALAVPLS